MNLTHAKGQAVFSARCSQQVAERRLGGGQAQPSRGDRADHRLRARRRARRAHRRRPDAGRRARAHPRPGDARHCRDDPRHSGGGDLPGRHQAGHRPSTDTLKDAHDSRRNPHPGRRVGLNADRPSVALVANTGDRPVQIGRHYHFFEANRALEFDRDEQLAAAASISPPPADGDAFRARPAARGQAGGLCGYAQR